MAAVCATAIAGCGSPPLRGPRIDERSGRVLAVGIGDNKRTIARRLGPHGDPQAYPIEPLTMEEGGGGGPWSVHTGPYHIGPGGDPWEQVTLRYPHVSFFVMAHRVVGFMETAHGAHTSRGVGVGSSLDDVARRYPSLTCEGPQGGDEIAVQEAHCAGRASGGYYLWFGGDPVKSVTVMEHDFDTYATY
jgi:hypothetical protein